MAITVPYYEMDGFPVETFTVNKMTAETKLWCAWDDRFSLLEQLGTYPDNVYPHKPAMGAVVTSVKMGKFPSCAINDSLSPLADYDAALITVGYSTRGPLSANLVTERLSTFRQYYRVNYNLLKWEDGTALTRDESPMRAEMGLTYYLKYHNLTSIPAVCFTLPGYVNSGATSAYLLDATFAAGTILYGGAVISRVISTSGTTNYDVEHVFFYKYNGGNGWNYAFRDSTGSYQKVNYKAGGQFTQYPTAAFSF